MNNEEVSQLEIPENPENLENPAEVKAPENVALGIVGALIGAAIGAACIILLSQLGYIASLSGVVLAFCTLKGYELLGKGISTKGIVICIVLMVITPFVADWIDWAIVVMQYYEGSAITFAEALLIVPLLMEDGSIAMSDYLTNLGMIYLFVALGAFYTVKSAFKKKK